MIESRLTNHTESIFTGVSTGVATDVLTAEDIMRAFQQLRDEYATEPPMFLISPRTSQRLRCWEHLARAYPLPRRKIRKCHMRKLYRRRQVALQRYLKRGGG